MLTQNRSFGGAQWNATVWSFLQLFPFLRSFIKSDHCLIWGVDAVLVPESKNLSANEHRISLAKLTSWFSERSVDDGQHQLEQLLEGNKAVFRERAEPSIHFHFTLCPCLWWPLNLKYLSNCTSSSLVRFTARHIAVIRHFYVTIFIRRRDWRINVFYFPIFRKLFVLFTFSTTPASCRGR